MNGAEDEPVTDDEDSCVGVASGDVGEELCGTPEQLLCGFGAVVDRDALGEDVGSREWSPVAFAEEWCGEDVEVVWAVKNGGGVSTTFKIAANEYVKVSLCQTLAEVLDLLSAFCGEMPRHVAL